MWRREVKITTAPVISQASKLASVALCDKIFILQIL